MRKEDYIRKRGIAAYEELLQQSKDWKKAHPKERRVINNKWAERNPEKVKAHGRKISRKGGKYYEHRRQHQANGIPHEKVLIRNKHGYHYRSYKRIIAPDSVLHHQWLPGYWKLQRCRLSRERPTSIWDYRCHTDFRRQNNATHRGRDKDGGMQTKMKCIILTRDNLVKIRYNDDSELNRLMEALGNVQDLDVQDRGYRR